MVPTWADSATRPTPPVRSPSIPTLLPSDRTLERTAAAGDADAVKAVGPRKFAIVFAAAAAVVVAVVVFSAWARAATTWRSTARTRRSCTAADGGVLWIDPTAQTTGGPTRDQLEPDRAAEIDDHARFDSEQEAADFIRDSATTTTTTTTTTSTTTTTLPPTTISTRTRPSSEQGPERNRGGRPYRPGSRPPARHDRRRRVRRRPRSRLLPFAQRRRNTELTLLVMAALITGSATRSLRSARTPRSRRVSACSSPSS